MARQLDEDEMRLLSKLIEGSVDDPEEKAKRYHAILPPLANHHSASVQDFAERLSRLSDEELSFVVGLVREGKEDLSRLEPEYVEAFLDVVDERLGREAALEVFDIYKLIEGL